ncbi:MAG: cytochrome c [Phycisphaerae bacterium]|nr:MAG: cytochrome c [Phycisphaerae bacterium]
MSIAVGLIAVVAAVGSLAGPDNPPAASVVPRADRIRYDRDIRPLLSDRCFLCHGTDAAARQANLRLDDPASAAAPRERGAAIVPGNPSASTLLKRLASHDPDEVMPPPTSTKRPFSADEIALVRRWIDEGAEYEPHWSFVPPARHRPPTPSHPDWARDEIDAFILAALDARGLSPSPEVDRATLLRRVTLDLTGLPPSAEDLAAFLADPSPDAYERVVDRVLTQEPHATRFGERMATPWLDQARYADTAGIHHDQGRSIWPYRDWVVRAFRDNMPFDRFVTEQLAGDLLPEATTDQIVATGFNRCHVTSDEGGAIEEEYLLEYAVDRTATAGAVYFGLTFGCARCHDHKFDPVTMTDFYSLLAFFNSIEEKGIDTRLDDPTVAYPPSITITSPEAAAEIAGLERALAHIQSKAEALRDDPAQAAGAAEFVRSFQHDGGVRWFETPVLEATSANGATMRVLDDGSVLAGGANPDTDTHTYLVRASETPRLLLVEALRDASVKNRVGRADNGNAVVTALRVEVISSDGRPPRPVGLTWAWASVEQMNDNFRVANLVTGDTTGWALAGHERGGDRAAVFLLDDSATITPGDTLRVTLEGKSIYARHVLARTRLTLGTIADTGLARLPTTSSAWFRAGPFPARTGTPVFDQSFGPESVTRLDPAAEFDGGKRWTYEPRIVDGGSLTGLSNTVGAMYIARTIFAPSARRLEVSLGTDDGVRVLAGGREVHVNRVERGLTPDADRFAFDVLAGPTTVIYKIVNTGGPDGFAHRDVPAADLVPHSLAAAILPTRAIADDDRAAFAREYVRVHSPDYRAALAEQDATSKRLSTTRAALPKSMIMKERPEPRATFVMNRGQYDHPDTSRPVARNVPAFLGSLPSGEHHTRLDLARWMVSDANPLLARVTVNRLWELFFGQGLVRTTEDLGLQGEYPSHPELLDTLAVEFRDGWDVKALVRRIVTSATYRQASRVRPEALAVDPDNRLLAYFPRRRLSAEVIRDQALLVSGLLVEKPGGPGVRPYQPPGLWEEVSMPDSNTGKFVRDSGDALWRRSLYTFWKRASPAPAMLTFDVPTRESCVIRRPTTNTPLQALVLWNDEQFVEAARGLAARAIRHAEPDDARLRFLFLTAASREPTDAERDAMLAALAAYRARFAAATDDAAALLRVGESALPMDVDRADLASWTMLANAVLASDAVIVQR